MQKLSEREQIYNRSEVDLGILRGGGGSGLEYFKGGLGSSSPGIFIYWQAKKNKKNNQSATTRDSAPCL